MRIISLLSFTALVLTLHACSDFLNEELEGTYTSATFYKTEAHAELALTGVYNSIAFTSTNNALWVFGDVASDDAVKGGNPGDQSDIEFLEQFNYSRSNVFLHQMWEQYYEGITRANYLLHYGKDIAMDEARRAEIFGQAKFLRAYLYFNLVNIYGEVPVRLTPPISEGSLYVAKSPVESVYTQIEADLTEAVAALSPAPERSGEASKGAALALLAKVHLYQGEWQSALNAIQTLDDLGLYSLDPFYKNNFIDSTQNNTEAIFQIEHLSGQSPQLGSYLNQYFSPASENGYYFNAPVQGFVNEFEKTAGDVVDPRLDYTVGREGQTWVNGEAFDPNWSATGYLQRKHVQPLREVSRGTKGDAGLNYVYLRYADILLMKAEALNELHRTPEAVVPLNEVRRRARESYLHDPELPGFGVIPAGLLSDVAPTGEQDVREAIRHERRVELGFEFHRYFDLMRYGRNVAEAALAIPGFSYETDRYFLIPQSEIDSNPLISE